MVAHERRRHRDQEGVCCLGLGRGTKVTLDRRGLYDHV